MRLSSTSAAVFAAAAVPLASAQTYSDCNPTNASQFPCAPDLGLSTTSFSSDFTQGSSANESWSYVAESVNYASDGAEFTIAARGQAPTIKTDFSIFYGKVSVTMKAARGQGIISSIVLQSDDLDEIDWEFLGGDNGNVQTNYFGKGNTTTYDRGQTIAVSTPQDTSHTYTIDWTKESVKWQIDGTTVRTLNYADAVGGANFPQTPMNIRLGIWAGGDPNNGYWTIVWAGGNTTYSEAAGMPWTMAVEKVEITNYNPAEGYNYTDTTGSSDSIKLLGDYSASTTTGAVASNTGSGGNAAATSAGAGLGAGAHSMGVTTLPAATSTGSAVSSDASASTTAADSSVDGVSSTAAATTSAASTGPSSAADSSVAAGSTATGVSGGNSSGSATTGSTTGSASDEVPQSTSTPFPSDSNGNGSGYGSVSASDSSASATGTGTPADSVTGTVPGASYTGVPVGGVPPSSPTDGSDSEGSGSGSGSSVTDSPSAATPTDSAAAGDITTGSAEVSYTGVPAGTLTLAPTDGSGSNTDGSDGATATDGSGAGSDNSGVSASATAASSPSSSPSAGSDGNGNGSDSDSSGSNNDGSGSNNDGSGSNSDGNGNGNPPAVTIPASCSNVPLVTQTVYMTLSPGQSAPTASTPASESSIETGSTVATVSTTPAAGTSVGTPIGSATPSYYTGGAAAAVVKGQVGGVFVAGLVAVFL